MPHVTLASHAASGLAHDGSCWRGKEKKQREEERDYLSRLSIGSIISSPHCPSHCPSLISFFPSRLLLYGIARAELLLPFVHRIDPRLSAALDEEQTMRPAFF